MDHSRPTAEDHIGFYCFLSGVGKMEDRSDSACIWRLVGEESLCSGPGPQERTIMLNLDRI